LGRPGNIHPKAKALGFDAVELFTSSAASVSPEVLAELADRHGIAVAAVGTGAGKVLNGWSLTSPEKRIRRKAVEFISDMIAFGARFNAPAIIGSMQGSVAEGIDREQALAWLAEGLNELGRRAGDQGVKLIYEPLNRYETNLINLLGDAVNFLKTLEAGNVTLLADLFHMNMEEASMGDAIRSAGDSIGHLHFADSNRRPVGMGHTDMKEIAEALRDIDYGNYASAEAFPYPDPDAAAAQTMKAYKEYLAAN